MKIFKFIKAKIFEQYKLKNLIKSSIFLYFILILVSCDKENNIDYRDTYTGNYVSHITFNYPVYEWNDSLETDILTWYDSVYSFKGYIKKSANSENRILIHWGNDTICIINDIVFTQTNNVIVDTSGNLSYPEYDGGGHTHFYPPAFIKNDSVRFNFGCGGIGMYKTWNILGIKE